MFIVGFHRKKLRTILMFNNRTLHNDGTVILSDN